MGQIEAGWLFTVAGIAFGAGVMIGGYVFRWGMRSAARQIRENDRTREHH